MNGVYYDLGSIIFGDGFSSDGTASVKCVAVNVVSITTFRLSDVIFLEFISGILS